jgi:hypothetical protein
MPTHASLPASADSVEHSSEGRLRVRSPHPAKVTHGHSHRATSAYRRLLWPLILHPFRLRERLLLLVVQAAIADELQ